MSTYRGKDLKDYILCMSHALWKRDLINALPLCIIASKSSRDNGSIRATLHVHNSRQNQRVEYSFDTQKIE